MGRLLKLSGDTFVLEKRLTVPISNKFTQVRLVGFYSRFLTPNVTTKNNRLHYEKNVSGLTESVQHVMTTMFIPPGQYTLEDSENFIQSQEHFNATNITIDQNRKLSRVVIKSDFKHYFDQEESIGSVIGFKDQIVEPKTKTLARDLPKIIPIEMIKIHFNLADGMFEKYGHHFHRETNVIASVMIDAEFGGPIIYEPRCPVFVPVFDKIQNIRIEITDEEDNLIDFNGAITTVVLEMQ